jgi:hypothetical protein
MEPTMKTLSTVALLMCALACAGCLAITGYAPPRFSGQVFDSVTKAPIANAQVRITPYWSPDWLATGVSDSAGRFVATAPRISPLAVSPDELWTDARIEVVAEGYQAQPVAELDLAKRESTNIMVYLKRRE